MDYVLVFKNLCQLETRRLFMVMGIIAICVLLLQTFTFPDRPENKVPFHEETRLRIEHPALNKTLDSDLKNDVALEKNQGVYDVSRLDEDNVSFLEEASDSDKNSNEIFALGSSVAIEQGSSDGVDVSNKTMVTGHFLDESESNNSSPVLKVVRVGEVSSLGRKPSNGIEGKKQDLKNEDTLEKNQGVYDASGLDEDDESFLEEASDLDKNSNDIFDVSNTTMVTGNTTVEKLKACNMPPQSVTTISEMNSLLLQRRGSTNFTKPHRLSTRDKELLSARSQIENAPKVRNNGELYAPLFRNLSVFRRSYELMERTLKVHVYKEGEKPIFHQPLLKGVYASEGWFMKLMEENKKFRVKDPRKAHLFYMPFSSRLLEFSLYVPNSHNRLNLRAYLGNYTNTIAAKYPFWNRTGGADHFFVACHDWAPYETRHHMERCVKCMCNADVTQGFEIGKDVSLPETYVRSARNPVRDIGGEPPSNRSILAFFAGSMHGYLRPILLSHWENKDPDMKILGRMPFGVASKMEYIRYMKTSKYCVCAKGYNVNSPRVVEAIFYECVPVIISDNFVPPFFNVLNWDSFSVIVAEKDIPNLKNILVSIPHEKYVALQMAVKKAQRHFVWHSKPAKYDLFHMTLHSIWYNRVFMIKAR